MKDCSEYLSNYEVLDLLKNIKTNKKQKKQSQLATITYETIRYLEETPCAKQTPEKIQQFLKSCKTYKLSKCEKLTLLNLVPKTALEIQLVYLTVFKFFILFRNKNFRCNFSYLFNFEIWLQTIEDGEDRLTEEEVDSLLETISNLDPEKPKEPEEEETMEEGNDG